MFRLVILSLFALFNLSFGATVPIGSAAVSETKHNFDARAVFPPMILAGKNDLVAVYDRSSQILVFKRTSAGIYDLFASRNMSATRTAMEYTATDGKWISFTPRILVVGSSETNSSCELFKVNEDGSISDYIRLDSDTIQFNYGDFLADGSFVGVSADQIFTFREKNNNWELVNVFKFPKKMKMTTKQISEYFSAPFFRFVGNYVVTFTEDFAEIHFYEHQANNTWSLRDVITTGTTALTSAVWNGDDTVLASNELYAVDASKVGIIYLYQRVNGTWSLTASMTGNDLNVVKLGSSIMAANRDNFLLGALFQRVFLVQRNDNGPWTINGAFTNPADDSSEYVVGLGMNAHDMFIARPKDVHVTSLCSVEPMTFTCDKTTLSECNFDTFDASLVCDYTTQCGDISTRIINFGIENSLLYHVQLEFTRFGAVTQRVNVSFSCPAVNAPSTGSGGNPSNGPLSASTPLSGSNPSTNNGPSMATVPVKSNSGPEATNNNVSSAQSLIISSWLIASVALLLVPKL